MANESRGKSNQPRQKHDPPGVGETEFLQIPPADQPTLGDCESTIVAPGQTEPAPTLDPSDSAETQFVDPSNQPGAETLPPSQMRSAAATGEFTTHGRGSESEEFTAAPDLTLNAGATAVFKSGDSHGFSVDNSLPVSDSQIRQTEVGDYKILGILGRGGMGVVYRAHDKKLGRDVALKMVLSGNHASQEQLQRFISEAQAVAHLQHPNIVQIFEVGDQDGLPYFSLEFVDGQALDDRINESLPTDRESAQLMETICRAMQYAHDHHILHRDLKPANVLVSTEGVPKVTDFGLAKKLEDADESASTRTGTVMGTPSYMSPEQAKGMIHDLGPATDQYSLGAMLYELLTGRPPFVGAKAIETIMQVVREEPVPPRQMRPQCPVDLETICLKALQKDPEKRYPSCQAMADDLRRYLDGVPIEARPVSQFERVWRWCRRNPRIAIPSAASILLLLVATGVSTWSYLTVAQKNVEILAERDYAQSQERIAKQQTEIAQVQQQLAEEREKTARSQSKLALESLQFVQTNIDDQLKKLPGMAEVRIRIMEDMAKKWEELEVALTGGEEDATGERGEAMATLMASRARTAESLLQLGQVQQADSIYAELLEQAKRRIEVMDNMDAARFNLATIYVRRADTQQKLNPDPQVAMQLNQQALSIIEDIKANPKAKPYDPAVDNSPEEYERELETLEQSVDGLHAAVLKGLGVHYLNNGNLSQAAEYFAQAYTVAEKTLAEIRGKPGFDDLKDNEKDNLTAARQLGLDTSGLALAYIYLRLGRTEDSLKRYAAAIAGRREIVERRPDFAILENGLAGFLGNYGTAYLWLDRPEDARPLLEESRERFASLLERDPKNSLYINDLATAHYRVGTYFDVVGEPEQAAKHFVRCKELREQLLQLSPNESNKERLMLALSRCGEQERAMELIDELGQTDVHNGELHLERARSLAQLSRHANASQDRSQLIDAALTALERAVADGYGDPFRIQAEQDLDPLHSATRFQELIATMSTAAQ